MNWKTKRVLVTGASGFIGSHLVEQLVKLGAEVTALLEFKHYICYGLISITTILTFIRTTTCLTLLIEPDLQSIFH